MISHPKRILGTAIVVAWFFDFLFWGKSPGISFVIFVGITLGAGLYLAWKENRIPSRSAVVLVFPILLFAFGTFFRREPFTTFANYLATIVLMGLFARTFLGGRWLHYSLSDYIAAFFYLFINALAKPLKVLSEKKSIAEDGALTTRKTKSKWERVLPVIRGLLIAIPIVAIFAFLFAAADPIFESYLEDFIKIFKLENLPEYIFRGIYILTMGYLLTGIYVYAFTNEQDELLIGEEKPWLPTFLGFTESAIILSSVNALFAAFVGIQFRYFFGGQANIKIDGYTYAEYARRGFGELVAVSFFSLLLLLGLSTITRRERDSQRKTFSGLGIGLVVLVGVILISAFQRLLLYEEAYGFTRLRIYSHVFMVWLGILLTAVMVLELFRNQRAFALAGLIVSVGFVVSLNVLNVDGQIIRRNVQRVLAGADLLDQADIEEVDSQALDTFYLQSLSTDATPALIRAQVNPRLSEDQRNELAAVLACQIAEMSQDFNQRSWQSYHFGDARAWKLLKESRDNFRAAQVYKDRYGSWWVLVNELHRPCQYDPFRYD